MAQLGAKNATTTTSTVADFSVSATALDYEGTTWEFNDATKNLGYYFNIPELKGAIDALATWTVGKGWETESDNARRSLELIEGWGEDSFQSIVWNMIVMKKIVGDSFAEIIRNEGELINIKPISPERVRINLDGKGIIKDYDVRKKDGKYTNVAKENMLHQCNERIGVTCSP